MDMTLPSVIAALVTFLSPLLVALFNRVGWSAAVKNAVAFGVALVIAVVYLIVTGGITDWSNVAGAIGIIYTLQQLIFNYLLEGISSKVEAATDSTYRGNGKHIATNVVTTNTVDNTEAN